MYGRTLRPILYGLLPLLIAVLGACSDNPVNPTSPAAPPSESPLEPGLYPEIVVDHSTTGEFPVWVNLKPVGNQPGLASYQGEVVYDTLSLQLVSAELPGEVMGSWGEAKHGHVRFAAAATDEVAPGTMLLMHFRGARKPLESDLRLHIEEVISAGLLENVTDSRVVAGHPLFRFE